MSHFRGSWRRIACALAVTIACVGWVTPARGAVQSFFITGEVTGSTFGPIPVGTPFTGSYSFDDAAVDTDPGAAVGDYATGAYTLVFSPAIGEISFDVAPSINVGNDVPFLGDLEDRFVIEAAEGARATPGFSNAINSSNLLFSDVESGGPLPAALTSDALTVVPHTAGAPWDTQTMFLEVNAVPSGCVAFGIFCTVTLEIQTIGLEPEPPPVDPSAIPTLAEWGLLLLALGLGLAGLGTLRR
jgi:hypothetical protein